MTAPHAISARLTTLCGCRQFVTVPAPAPSEYLVAIGVRKLISVVSKETWDQFINRRFKLVAFNPTDASVEADYIEVAE